MKKFIVAILLLFSVKLLFSQGCCSGGASSPIAGNAASGVLLKNQLEIANSYQFVSTHVFKTNNNRDTVSILDDTLRTNYLFLRTDYGLIDKLTMSVALGYFFDKTLVNKSESYSSSGVSDLILFPRYNLFNWKRDNHRTEITIGLGLKVPLGSYKDSSLKFSHPLTGDLYAYNPTAVQLTNGSLDAMFYSFFFRTYPKRKLRIFANTLYIKKSYNPLGQKFGDLSSLSLYVGKTIYKSLALTGQLNYETVAKTQAEDGVDLISYNIEDHNTGSKKLLFIPQISYSHDNFSYFVSADIPLYQDLNGFQFATQRQFTAGVSYRILTKEPVIGGVIK